MPPGITMFPVIVDDLVGTGEPVDPTLIYFDYAQVHRQDPKVIMAWAELLGLRDPDANDILPCIMRIFDNRPDDHIIGEQFLMMEFIEGRGYTIVGVDPTLKKFVRMGAPDGRRLPSAIAEEKGYQERLRCSFGSPKELEDIFLNENHNIAPENPDGLPLHMNFEKDVVLPELAKQVPLSAQGYAAAVEEEYEEEEDDDENGPTPMSKKWEYQDRHNALYNGRYPLEMFPQPVDDYLPPCVPPEAEKEVKRKSLRRRKSTPFARASGVEDSDEENFVEPKVEYKYPDREPSSPRWLTKMFDQLKKDRRELEDDLEDALKDVKDLTYEARVLKMKYNMEVEENRKTMETMKLILPTGMFEKMTGWVEMTNKAQEENEFCIRGDDKYDMVDWERIPSPGLGNALGFSGDPSLDKGQPKRAPASATGGANVAGSSKLPDVPDAYQPRPAASRTPPADRPISPPSRNESPVEEETQLPVRSPVFRPPSKDHQKTDNDPAGPFGIFGPPKVGGPPSLFSSDWRLALELMNRRDQQAPRPLSPVADEYPSSQSISEVPNVEVEELYNGGSVSAKVPLAGNRARSDSDSSGSSSYSTSTSSDSSDSSSDSSDSSSDSGAASDAEPSRKDGNDRPGSRRSKRSRDGEDEDEEPKSPPKRARSAEFKAPLNSQSGPASGNRQTDSAGSPSKRAREDDNDEHESPVKKARNFEYKVPGTPFKTPMGGRRPRADSPAVSVSASRNRALQAEVESAYFDSPTESEIEVENSALYVSHSDESADESSVNDILPDTSGMHFEVGSSPAEPSSINQGASDSDDEDDGVFKGFAFYRRKMGLSDPDSDSGEPDVVKAGSFEGGFEKHPCGPVFPVRPTLVTPLNLEFEKIEENYKSDEDSDYSPSSDDSVESSDSCGDDSESVCSDFLPADNESVSSVAPEDDIATRGFKEKGRMLHLVSYDLGYSARAGEWEMSSCIHMPPEQRIISRDFPESTQYTLLEHEHIRFSEKHDPGNALVPPEQVVRPVVQRMTRHYGRWINGVYHDYTRGEPEHVQRTRALACEVVEESVARHNRNEGLYEDRMITRIMNDRAPMFSFHNEDGTKEGVYHDDEDVLEGALRQEGGGSSRNHY